MSRIKDLNKLGQSIWLDFIRRSLISSGELDALIARGVSGITSNPTIFEKAIAGSADYDDALREMVDEGKTNDEIYLALALDDIRRAADLFRPIYDATGGADGYVSLEVNPKLARDTKGTIAEAKMLFKILDRPNVMIKVPATAEGVPAIEALIASGVNVNVTLIFSLAHYEAVVRAYIGGLEKLADRRGNLGKVASVASFFVSRIDTAVDKKLQSLGNQELQGKAAIASARLAYDRFRAICALKRWEKLAGKGARVQRLLWGSTGTKNPRYPDTLYVDELIGPDTVNTLPPATLQAFLDHGMVAPTLRKGIKATKQVFAEIDGLGIRMDEVANELQREGVLAFETSFDALMASIRSKRDEIRAGWKPESTEAGTYREKIDEALAGLRDERIMDRIWAKDHTVWKPEPTEIANRLGWLTSAGDMMERLDEIEAFAKGVRSDGFTQILLLGMGGSSLAPEVFAKTFGSEPGWPTLAVLDSTDPSAVLRHAGMLDPARTLFIVSSKSGTTVEILSFFKFFYNWAVERLGGEKAGGHFAAITDPGSQLEQLARQYRFRQVFLNDPDIGGRFSALSCFGLVPAALIGFDVKKLLERALTMAANCDASNCPVKGDNHGARLGAYLGRLAQLGRDKLTLITSPSIQHFGDWVEQLIAESTGKEGKGILPVLREAPGKPEVYGPDRVFVGLEAAGEPLRATFIRSLEDAGHPVEIFRIHEPLRPGRAVLPLDDGHRRGGQVPGHQPLRPARRGGRQGERERGREGLHGKRQAAGGEARAELRGRRGLRQCEGKGYGERPGGFPGGNGYGRLHRRHGLRERDGRDGYPAAGLPHEAARPLPGPRDRGLRPPFPSLDGPAPQGRRRQGAFHPAHGRRRRGHPYSRRAGIDGVIDHLRDPQGGPGHGRPAGPAEPRPACPAPAPGPGYRRKAGAVDRRHSLRDSRTED